MTSKRRMRRIRGKRRTATVARAEPRHAGLTSEMPNDLRALAREGLRLPYEADAEYGPEVSAALEDLMSPDKGRRRFLTRELSEGHAESIKNTKMIPRHDHLNALLDDNFGRRLLEQKGTIPPDVDLEY